MIKYLLLSLLLSTPCNSMIVGNRFYYQDLTSEYTNIKLNSKLKCEECDNLIIKIDRELGRNSFINERTVVSFNKMKEDLIQQIMAWRTAETLEDPLLCENSPSILLKRALNYGYFIEELDYLKTDLIVYQTTASDLGFYYGKKLHEIIKKIKPIFDK